MLRSQGKSQRIEKEDPRRQPEKREKKPLVSTRRGSKEKERKEVIPERVG